MKIVRGIPNALKALGWARSAGIKLEAGPDLFAVYDERQQPPRIMILAHPSLVGQFNAIELLKCTADSGRTAGDLLDELVDPANRETIELCAHLAKTGAL